MQQRSQLHLLSETLILSYLSDNVELKPLSGCEPLFVAAVAVLDFVVQSVQSKLLEQCHSIEAPVHYKLLS